jgi:heme-degrading monooxygenase HmoA
MVAVIKHLRFSKPVSEFEAAVEREALPLLSTFPGFRDFSFLRIGEDRAVVIILWASAAEAANGAKEFGPDWFAQNFAPYRAGEQQHSFREVIFQYES